MNNGSWLEISTNIGCPNKCTFCPQAKIINQYSKTKGPFIMKFKTFKTCIDKVPKTTTIIFSGMSEPWINPECTKMVMYAHQKGYRLFIYTSLVGMKISDIEKLKNISFDYDYGFMVHLPSIDKIEKITIDKNYLKILNTLIKSGIKAEFHYHGTKPNPKLNLPNIIHTPIQDRAGNLSSKKEIKKGKIACRRFLKANLLLPNGDVLLCCQDYEMKHVIGNLLKSDYKSLFYSNEYKKILEGMENEKLDILCRTCNAYAYETNLINNCEKKKSNFLLGGMQCKLKNIFLNKTKLFFERYFR